MDKKLTKTVLDKIKEIYPKISSKDIIVLLGSRAKGFALKDSDIDIMIFTKNYDYFTKTSIKKGLRNSGEDAGFEIYLDNNLQLEVKIIRLQIPKFDVMFYHDILTAQPLTCITDFKAFQNKIKKEFMKNYDDLLFYSYIKFFNEFKNLEGLPKRKDKLSKINLSMKKGIVIQALLRLILVMDKKPYTFDKYLSHEVSKTKHWNKVSLFIRQISEIDSLEDFKKLLPLVRQHIDSSMPKKPYVGNWWKHLKRFKEF